MEGNIMKTTSIRFEHKEDKILKERGTLFKLTIHGPLTTRRVKEDNKWLKEDVPEGAANVYTRVIPTKNIKPARKVANDARKYVRKRALDINISGFYYIPSSYVQDVIDQIKTLEKEYKAAAQEHLIEKYDTWKGQILKKNKKLKEELIPKKEYLESTFYFEYSFAEITPPYGLEGHLEDDVLQAEMEKYKLMIQTAFTLAILMIRMEMLEILAYVIERLGYEKNKKGQVKKRIFKVSMIENFQEFWRLILGKIIVQDRTINHLVRKMQEIFAGEANQVAQMLRKDEGFRNEKRAMLVKAKKVVRDETEEIKRQRQNTIPPGVLDDLEQVMKSVDNTLNL
jgi:hypothetical protein